MSTPHFDANVTKIWILRGVALMVSATAALVVLDIALRVTGLAAPPAVLSVTERQFNRIPGVFVPKETVTFRKEPRAPHLVTINSLGYRGEELPEAGPGSTRILFVGDSFTWGDLVDDQDALPARLEMGIEDSCPGAVVVNAGVAGTTIDSQLEMIRRGFEVEPDLIVLMFHGNDLVDLIPPTFWEMMAENRRQKSTFPLSLVYGTLNRTAIWTLIRRVRVRFGQQTGSGEIIREATEHSPTEQVPALKEQYASIFDQVRAELHERGIPLVVTAFPNHRVLIEDEEYANHLPWFRQLAESRGVDYADIHGALLESGETVEELYFLPWDGHARPLGYEIGGRVLSDKLEEVEPILSWCGAAR